MGCARARAGSLLRARTGPSTTPTPLWRPTRSSRRTTTSCSSERREPNPPSPAPGGRTSTRTDAGSSSSRASTRTDAGSSSSRASKEEPFLRSEVSCPLEAACGCEAQVGAEGVADRADEPVGAARREAVLPPDVEHLHAGSVPADPRFDPADETVAEDDREHVIPPSALCRREKALPHVVEGEQTREQGGVPQQRVERGDERDGGGRLRRRLQQRELLGEDEALAAHALDVDGHERAALDQLREQLVAPRPLRGRLRRGDAVERAAGATGAEQAVGTVPRQELMPELLSLRHLLREHLDWEQPFEEVVVPAIAVAPREADHARDGVRLEHGAHSVLRHPEPVLRRTSLALEVE